MAKRKSDRQRLIESMLKSLYYAARAGRSDKALIDQLDAVSNYIEATQVQSELPELVPFKQPSAE